MPNLSITPNPGVRFTIVIEDDGFLVVDKPAGVPSQPGKGHADDTLLNGLFAAHGARLQNLGAERDFGLLHRLDRMASGLVLVGLRARAYDALRLAFAERRVEKRYWVVVRGAPTAATGVIRAPIVETLDRRGRKIARVVRGGGKSLGPAAPRRHGPDPTPKPAVTAYKTVSRGSDASLLECRIGTGRLHQIRVHLAALGCPVLGDDIYGDEDVRRTAPRLALHAFFLHFHHPESGDPVRAMSPWPDDLGGLLRRRRLAKPTPESVSEASGDLSGGVDEPDSDPHS